MEINYDDSKYCNLFGVEKRCRHLHVKRGRCKRLKKDLEKGILGLCRVVECQKRKLREYK